MEFLLIAVIIGLLPAAIASSKGRSFVVWWIYGALLWIVATPHALMLRANQTIIDQAKAAEGYKRCPACAEMVRAEASICKHCNTPLEPAGAAPASSAPLRIVGDGRFDYEIVGESYYQAALDEICGGKCVEGHQIELPAALVPDPTNEHDPNAVKVVIRGKHVGFLARSEAAAYRKALSTAGRGAATAQTSAKIVGGWDDGEDEGHYGVKLDIPQPISFAASA